MLNALRAMGHHQVVTWFYDEVNRRYTIVCKDHVPTQAHMFAKAQRNHAAMLTDFADLMASDNPLTVAELRQMAKTHPQYAFMLVWADRLEKEQQS